MPQLDQLSACPGCGEPLAPADRTCGSCGQARQSAPGPAPDTDFPLPPPHPPAGDAPDTGAAGRAAKRSEAPRSEAPRAPAGPPEAAGDAGDAAPPDTAAAQGGTAAPARPATPPASGAPAPPAAPPAPAAPPVPTAPPVPPEPAAPPAPTRPPSPGTHGSAPDGPARPAPGLAPQAGDGTPEPPPVPGAAGDAGDPAPRSTPGEAAQPAPVTPPEPAAPPAPAGEGTGGTAATPDAGQSATEPIATGGPTAGDAAARDTERRPADDDGPAGPPASTEPQGTEPAGGQASAPDPRLRDTALPAPESPAPRCVVCGTGAVDEDGYCTDCGRAQPGDRDHVERSLGGVGCVTDLGKRHHRNEDAFSISATALPDGTPAVIAVVCDGVSSSSRPHEASAAAADAAGEALLAALPRGQSGKEAMREALLTAGTAVDALADHEQEPGRNSPACTVVSAVTTGSELTVGWVGDSRAYWLPTDSGHPIRLTEDDSWAAQMVKAGLLSEEEAMADRRAHAITAWLGADNPELAPHAATFKPDKPGVVVICTDGLWNYADAAEEMAARLPASARSAPLEAARDLVRFALDSGGHDNVTVAVLPFPTPGLPATRTATGRAAEPQAPEPTETQSVTRPIG